MDSNSGLMDANSDSDSGLVDSDSLLDSRVRTHSNTASKTFVFKFWSRELLLLGYGPFPSLPIKKVWQGHNRHIFLGRSHFSWFIFPAWIAFSRYKIPILVDPKQISVVLKSEKQKRKSSPLFVTFPPSFFQFFTSPSLFQFSFFPFLMLHFPYFPSLSFPNTSAEISHPPNHPLNPLRQVTQKGLRTLNMTLGTKKKIK